MNIIKVAKISRKQKHSFRDNCFKVAEIIIHSSDVLVMCLMILSSCSPLKLVVGILGETFFKLQTSIC